MSKTLEGETVLLKEEDWRCLLLNRTAGYIWHLSNGRNSLRNIVDSISKKYNIKKSPAKKDIQRLLFKLKKKRFMEFLEQNQKKGVMLSIKNHSDPFSGPLF